MYRKVRTTLVMSLPELVQHVIDDDIVSTQFDVEHDSTKSLIVDAHGYLSLRGQVSVNDDFVVTIENDVHLN